MSAVDTRPCIAASRPSCILEAIPGKELRATSVRRQDHKNVTNETCGPTEKPKLDTRTKRAQPLTCRKLVQIVRRVVVGAAAGAANVWPSSLSCDCACRFSSGPRPQRQQHLVQLNRARLQTQTLESSNARPLPPENVDCRRL